MKTFVELVQEIKKSFDQEDRAVLANIEDSVELTSTAAHPHAVGSYFVFGKTVCETTVAIAVDDTIAIGTNCKVADDIMALIAAVNTAISSEATTRASADTAFTNEIATMNKLGAKNLLKNGGINLSTSEVEFVKNDDGSVTFTADSTTTTVNSYTCFVSNSFDGYLKVSDLQGDVILNGSDDTTGNTYYVGAVYRDTSNNFISQQQAYNGDLELVIPNNAYWIRFEVVVKAGFVGTKTVYPMLRYKSIKDPTFVPYSMTNQQLTGSALNYHKNGSVNLCPNNAITQVVNNVTWSVNSDTKEVTTSGYCNVSNQYSGISLGNCKVKAGETYKLSGCPTGGGNEKYQIYGIPRTSAGVFPGGEWIADRGEGQIFTVPNGVAYYEMWMRSYYNVDVTGLVFKPMITRVDYPFSDYAHYVPYAKTNRKITTELGPYVIEERNYATNNGTVNLAALIYGKVVQLCINIHPSTNWAAGSGSRITFNLPSSIPKPSGVVAGVGLNKLSGLVSADGTVRLQNNGDAAVEAGNDQDITVTYVSRSIDN